MGAPLRPEGVHTALVTPFAVDESLDLPAFRALVRRQVAGGVQGLVVAGTTGESPTLDAGERDALLAVALEEAKGQLVTMGVGTNVTRSTVQNCARARDAGAHAGLLVLPYYNKPTPDGLRAHVRAACETGLPIVVYHVPGRTGQRLAPELLAELCNLPGVVGCKEATGDVQYGQDFMLRSPAPVLSGDDFTWLPLLSVGATGVISVLSNLAPRDTVAVWQAWRAGDTGTAAQAHKRLYPLVHWLFSKSNPVPAKAALAALGLCGATCRLPLTAGEPPPSGLLDGLA
jgi:4-hydroxy-tetrahydrodipicolinate synthase